MSILAFIALYAQAIHHADMIYHCDEMSTSDYREMIGGIITHLAQLPRAYHEDPEVLEEEINSYLDHNYPFMERTPRHDQIFEDLAKEIVDYHFE
jgi:hypothetical protein